MNKPSYWFPVKTYGWGWGLPVTWQGWVVMLVFMVTVLAGGWYVLPRYGEGIFLAFTFVCCVVLLAICWAKGEPPAWRWRNGQPPR